MALFIPRIEYNEVTEVGSSTITNPTLTLMADTSDIAVGMYCTGTAIPAATTVLSKTSSTVTLSANATANGAGVTFTFFKRFDFTYPPTVDSEWKFRPKQSVGVALSGERQVQTNYVEAQRDMTFGFITSAQRTILQDQFYLAWAVTGESFRYFPDQDETSTYEDCELNIFNFDNVRQIKKHPLFLYQFKLGIRRIEQ